MLVVFRTDLFDVKLFAATILTLKLLLFSSQSDCCVKLKRDGPLELLLVSLLPPQRAIFSKQISLALCWALIALENAFNSTFLIGLSM